MGGKNTIHTEGTEGTEREREWEDAENGGKEPGNREGAELKRASVTTPFPAGNHSTRGGD